MALAMCVVFVADLKQGRLLCSSLASYHAYLEFPVLLALLTVPVRSRCRS
ncbi:MAG: hypothetical protein J2P15_23020 [Micromonosporaceae bacterium]|nr:hypothetical protein [Micromonosporaceae bacterium]